MSIIILRIFLLSSLFMVWLPDLLVLGSAKSENFKPEQVKTRSTNFIYASWVIVYLLWIFIVALYCFKLESVGWFWKISPLGNDGVKIFAIVITCLGYYLLMLLGAFQVRKSIKPYIIKGERTPLVTTGIFHYSRNPMYLSIDIGVLGTFLIMPNLPTLIMAAGMIAVLYAVSRDEEKRLLEIYGEEYEKYRRDVGLVFPKLKRG